MSASPRPQTDESPDPSADAEGWALLDGLRRRLDEHANQNRKLQTQVTQLAESIAAMVTQQRKRSRWLNLNSFVAYVMFTLLCGGAFYFVYKSRAHEVVAERDRVIDERDAAVKRADQSIAKTLARDAADVKAWDAYQLLEAGKREDAAKKLVDLQSAPLSRFERTVLDARAKQAEVMQIEAALKQAAAAFKVGHHAEVVAPLEAAIKLETTGPRSAQMHYYLGVAYAKTGQLENAIVHLQAAVAADVDVEDARFHLASVLDRAGQWGKAKVEYDRFATAHPMSSYTQFATRRAATLDRMPPVAPLKAMTAAGAQPPAIPGATPAPKPAAAAKKPPAPPADDATADTSPPP
jgi:tetratricopeptide (TPR) repeat protein